MKNITKKDIIELIIKRVCKMKKLDHNLVTADTHLAAVGIDSLSAVLMCGYLEEAYDIEVEPILMFEYKTANEVADAVLTLIKEQS